VRLSDVNAALASVQLKRVPGWIARRQAFGEAFNQGISGLPGVKPHPQPAGAKPSYWWALFSVDPEVLGVNAVDFCRMVAAEGIPAFASPQQYVLKWQVFRRLHKDPAVFNSYRPGRLDKGAYPLEACPNARTCGERVCAVRMTQHNTVGEANAAARAVRKVTEALLGQRV
jgi:dTDP-4-amino-4,6-dideoxygalactose transaminase